MEVAQELNRERKMGWQKRDQERDNAICGMYLSGASVVDVAKEFGVSRTRVGLILERNYVEVNSAHHKLMRFFREVGIDPSKFDNGDQALDAWQRFLEQRSAAKQRKIEWNLTFEEWWDKWRASGKWEFRGIFAGNQYVMSRVGDVGPYSASNVVIKTHSENIQEGWTMKPDRYKSVSRLTN